MTQPSPRKVDEYMEEAECALRAALPGPGNYDPRDAANHATRGLAWLDLARFQHERVREAAQREEPSDV